MEEAAGKALAENSNDDDKTLGGYLKKVVFEESQLKKIQKHREKISFARQALVQDFIGEEVRRNGFEEQAKVRETIEETSHLMQQWNSFMRNMPPSSFTLPGFFKF